MDFSLSEPQTILQKTARDFARKSVLPRASEIDHSAAVPSDLLDELKRLGFYGLPFPVGLGGGGAGFLGLTLATEQICQASMAVGLGLSLTACVGEVVSRFGTEKQKRKYLKPLVRGETIAFWAFTEPATGSDPRAIETKARLDKRGFVLQGQKLFISLVPVADWGIVFARDDTELVSAFVVEKCTPGFVYGGLHDVMGARGLGASTIYLDQLRVPRQNVLGEKGEGYQILLDGASLERLALATGCLGVGQGALALSVDYARERIAYGKPIAEMPTIQWMLAEMDCKVQASRWLTYRTAYLKDEGQSIAAESAEAKLFCSQAVVDVVRMAMQIHGAYGTERQMAIERLYRDAKMTEIIVGVSEIQRAIIAASLLK